MPNVCHVLAYRERPSSPLRSQNVQKECWDVIWLAESLHHLVRVVSLLGRQSPRLAPLFEHLGLAVLFSVFSGQRLIGYWVCHCLLNLFGGFSDTLRHRLGIVLVERAGF